MIKRIALAFTLLLTVFTLSACKPEEVVDTPDTNPVITGETSVSYVSGTEFDPLAGVTASDAEDGDLTSSIVVVSNNVDTLKAGVYTVELAVTDSDDNTATMTITVSVALPLANYLSGVDLSKLPVDSKGILFAALETYLLDNVIAGVPLYTRASRVMFSSRVQLYSPEYNGVLGFGTEFSQFTADDSTVLMYGDTYGNAGEYTWRGSFNTDPTNLNPWIADDSNSSDFIGRFTGGLYEFHFDASKTGYQIDPSLASAEPVAVNPEVVNGKTYAKVWQIPVRDDLVWTFHEDIDTSGFAAGYEKLDASDYLWTWKHAMDNSWFRARSGGGDFITMGIKNAAEYLDGSVTDFADVGLRMAADGSNTLELEFTTDKSAFDIKYMFSGASLSPINQELLEGLGGDSAYGLGPDTVASSGVYVFDTYTSGQLLTFVKNPNHPDAEMYHYTAYQYRFIDGSDQIFAEFLAGRLDSAAVPASQVEDYAGDPRVKVSPDATTWRLMINGFGTEDVRDAYIADHPEFGLSETWVPEPILQYTEMKQALYYGFDRYEAAVNVVKTYLPAYTLFAPTYFLDGESGISVRGTDAGAAVLDYFGAESYGYFPDASVALFKQAVAKGIEDGYYTAGTADAYTEITLELYWASSGNTGAQAMVANLKEQYEALLVDDVNFVKVILNVNDVDFPGNYYDHMMIADMDLGIGGISGSLLDAPGFLDVFCDDNRGGFTLNWGIDTSTPNIAVTYTNLDGVEVSEIWSYNALVAAINGNVYIKDGQEQVAWTDADSLIDAYLDMKGEVLDSSSDGSDLSEYVLGDTLTNIATDEEFDSLIAKIVVTESGQSVLYVISVEGTEYKLYSQAALFTSAEDAIKDHSGYAGYYLGSTGPLTDAEVAANVYLTGLGNGFTTVAEYAADNGAPEAYTEIYAVDWNGWSDAYIVLHIGDYYIGWVWL